MYFITSIQSNSHTGFSLQRRCFGYFFELDDALNAVINDVGSFRECFYDYIVIEYIRSGIYPTSVTETWFQWSENAPVGWTKMDNKPSEFEGVINFAIG